MTIGSGVANSRYGLALLLLLVASLPGGTALAADDWPVFKPGLWQSTRDMNLDAGAKQPPLEIKHCVDPSAEMREQRVKLTKGGCRFSPLVRSGKDYRYSADCKMGGLSMVSRSVLTVLGDSAYEIRIESEVGGQVTRELLRARRVGDCAK